MRVASTFALQGRWRWAEIAVLVAAVVTGVLFLVELGYWFAPASAPAGVTSTATWLGIGVALWVLLMPRVARQQHARS